MKLAIREAPEAVADAVRLVVLSAPSGITPGLVEFTVFGTPSSVAASNGDMWRDFVDPPDSAKPWCYWWWVNGHVDRETPIDSSRRG